MRSRRETYDGTNAMTNRASADQVIENLRTTSDKIRALARAGYLRTEISKLLNIRYQHVRKVLVDAGITEGLKRPVEMERSSDTIEVEPSEREPTPPTVLLEAGFQLLGEWHLVDGKIELDSRAPSGPGVYAFILGEAVVRRMPCSSQRGGPRNRNTRSRGLA